MQRFSASDAKYSYSPDHASIGTVEAGERFEVESVEGFSGYFRSPSDFTPEVYAEAEAHKRASSLAARSRLRSRTTRQAAQKPSARSSHGCTRP